MAILNIDINDFHLPLDFKRKSNREVLHIAFKIFDPFSSIVYTNIPSNIKMITNMHKSMYTQRCHHAPSCICSSLV
jgi:hypothetical protein